MDGLSPPSGTPAPRGALRLPPASPHRCDGKETKVFHLRSGQQRLVAHHQEFSILGQVTAEHQDGQAEHPARKQVHDLEQHPPSQPSHRLACLRKRRSATQSSIRAVQVLAKGRCPAKPVLDPMCRSLTGRRSAINAGNRATNRWQARLPAVMLQRSRTDFFPVRGKCRASRARRSPAGQEERRTSSLSFRDKLIFCLFPLVSGGAGAGLVYYPCQRLGA